MLAVFDNTVAKCPDALQSPHSAPSSSALKDGFLANHFASQHPGSVTVNLGTSGLISHSVEKQNPFLPRYFFPFKIVTHVFVLVSLVDFWDWSGLVRLRFVHVLVLALWDFRLKKFGTSFSARLCYGLWCLEKFSTFIDFLVDPVIHLFIVWKLFCVLFWSCNLDLLLGLIVLTPLRM